MPESERGRESGTRGREKPTHLAVVEELLGVVLERRLEVAAAGDKVLERERLVEDAGVDDRRLVSRLVDRDDGLCGARSGRASQRRAARKERESGTHVDAVVLVDVALDLRLDDVVDCRGGSESARARRKGSGSRRRWTHRGG